MDESQGPGHGVSVSQSWPFTSQLTPVPNYTAWWQRHVCVNNLPKVITWSRTRNRKLREQARYRYATESHNQYGYGTKLNLQINNNSE